VIYTDKPFEELTSSLDKLEFMRNHKGILLPSIIISGITQVGIYCLYTKISYFLIPFFIPLDLMLLAILYYWKKLTKMPLIVIDDIHSVFTENKKEYEYIAQECLGLMSSKLAEIVFISSEKSCLIKLQSITGFSQRINLITIPEIEEAEFLSQIEENFINFQKKKENRFE